MSMSDADYARVVAELKESKTHIPGRDPLSEIMQSMRWSGVRDGVYVLASLTRTANSDHTATGPYAPQIARAEALAKRVRGLTLWQVDRDLFDVVYDKSQALKTSAPSPADFDRALAAVQAAVELAERRPA